MNKKIKILLLSLMACPLLISCGGSSNNISALENKVRNEFKEQNLVYGASYQFYGNCYESPNTIICVVYSYQVRAYKIIYDENGKWDATPIYFFCGK